MHNMWVANVTNCYKIIIKRIIFKMKNRKEICNHIPQNIIIAIVICVNTLIINRRNGK